jgi:hypothetical protein
MPIRLWDPETGVCHSRLTGHDNMMHPSCIPQSTIYLPLAVAIRYDCGTLQQGSGAVIQNLPGAVGSVAWDQCSDTICLITGYEDGSLLKWQVIDEEDQCRVRLCWSPLTVRGATIQGVRGLTPLKRELLKQRGAIAEPAHLFRDAREKISRMVSAVSEFAPTFTPPKEQVVRQ